MPTPMPHWYEEPRTLGPDDVTRMSHVVSLADRNVAEGTGGPFASGIWAADGSHLADGVNQVVPTADPTAHGEVTAIRRAGERSGHHLLTGAALYTSAEPCILCFGAIWWSGISRLVVAARTVDAEAIGFDEGPKPTDWEDRLRAHGIEVDKDVCRDRSIRVLQRYAGPIYNG